MGEGGPTVKLSQDALDGAAAAAAGHADVVFVDVGVGGGHCDD